MPRGAGAKLILPAPAAGTMPTGAGAAAGIAAPGITEAAGPAAGIGAIAGDGGAAAGVTAGALPPLPLPLPRTAAALFASGLAGRLFLCLFAIRFYLRSLFIC